MKKRCSVSGCVCYPAKGDTRCLKHIKSKYYGTFFKEYELRGRQTPRYTMDGDLT